MELRVDYRKLRGFIKEYYGTLEAYGKAIGIGGTQLNERLQGRIPFTQEEMFLTVQRAGVSEDMITVLFFTS